MCVCYFFFSVLVAAAAAFVQLSSCAAVWDTVIGVTPPQISEIIYYIEGKVICSLVTWQATLGTDVCKGCWANNMSIRPVLTLTSKVKYYSTIWGGA